MVFVAPKLIDLPIQAQSIAGRSLLVTELSPRNIRTLAVLPAFGGLILSEDVVSDISAAVERLRPADGRNWLLGELDRMADASHLLRAMVRAQLLRFDRTDVGLFPADFSVGKTAAMLGCSRAHAYAIAKKCGVDLRKMIDAVRLFLALEQRVSSGHTWEQVAWYVGYASSSGLTALAKRVVGKAPTSLDEEKEMMMLARRIMDIVKGS